MRIKRAKQSRYNPLQSIGDPAQLTRKLDAFEVGFLKEEVNIFNSLEQRDDSTLKRQLIMREMRKSLSTSEVPSEGAYPEGDLRSSEKPQLHQDLAQIGREEMPFQCLNPIRNLRSLGIRNRSRLFANVREHSQVFGPPPPRGSIRKSKI